MVGSVVAVGNAQGLGAPVGCGQGGCALGTVMQWLARICTLFFNNLEEAQQSVLAYVAREGEGPKGFKRTRVRVVIALDFLFNSSQIRGSKELRPLKMMNGTNANTQRARTL